LAIVVGAFGGGAACSSTGGKQAEGRSTAASASTSGAATTGKHRIEHEKTFAYPTGTIDQHPSITTPPPSQDFPDINSLRCTDTGPPSAKGTIKNTTGTTNDYHFEVDFYVEGQEYLGQKIAVTYVQVYMVKPGEKVQYSTAELEGETHSLHGKTSCRPKLIERRLSGPGSEAPKLSDVCKLLKTAEVAEIAGRHITIESRSNDSCSWEADDDTFDLSIVRTKPQAPTFTVKYSAPCDGSYGLSSENELVAVCQNGSKTYYITAAYNDPSTGTSEPPSPRSVRNIATRIELAMSRAK
jgi:hypothetical protein